MRKAAPFLVLSAAVLWGCIGLFIRPLQTAGLTSWQICALRCATTALILTVFLALYRPALLHIRLKDLWCFLGTGILSLLFFSWCYFTTIDLTSLSVAATLLYTAPIFVMLLSKPLFDESLTKRKICALILAFAGCLLVTGIFTGDTALSLPAMIVGIGSGFGYALYSVFGRFALLRGYHPFTITAWTFIVAGIAGVLFVDFPTVIARGVDHPEIGPLILGSAVVCGAAAYILYTLGLSAMETSTTSIMATLEPVMATVVGVLAFGETPTAANAAGMFLVLTAVILLRPRGSRTSAIENEV